MAEFGRLLRAVTETVSGVLGVRLGEGADEPVPQTGASPDPAPPAAEEPPVTEPALLEPEAGSPAESPAETAPEAAVEPAPEAAVAPEPVLDPVLEAAVDLAREVAVEVAGAAVGEHLGVEPEVSADGPVATHSFASTDRAYAGWRWAVTVARAAGDERVTVDEVVLLPGSGALLAPAWVPWEERVRPGDLSPGDLLPPPPDDPRLVPAYVEQDELVLDLHEELGLGRPRVLSREGRLDAAERWYEGEAGPDTALARQAPGRCGGCGFLVPLGGGLRAVFGVCANAVAPDDGRVVALDHGCGAHSETVVAAPHPSAGPGSIGDDSDLAPVE